MDNPAAIKDLINDLQWQIDELVPRGIKNDAGKPYNPAHYKRGLAGAIDTADDAVVDFVRRHLYKPPTGSYRKLEQAKSLDLVCEALVVDTGKSYSALFTDADREAAGARLAPHRQMIEQRIEERRTRMEAARARIRAKGVPRRWDLDSAMRTRRAT